MTLVKMETLTVKNKDGNIDKDGNINDNKDGKQKDNEAVAWSPCGAAFAR